MDPRQNPFAPGAGTPPPELAGRSGIINDVTVAVARAQRGQGKGVMLLGLRGVGKTVLLNKLATDAEAEGALAIRLEAPEDQSLPEMLIPELRAALLRLSRVSKASALAKRAFGVLRGFAAELKVKIGDAEFSIKPEAGVADTGNLTFDLPNLLESVALAAKANEQALVLCVDEVQYLEEEELAALIVAAHKLSQRALPFLLLGAGLPQLAALAGNAKSYAERLFDYPEVGPLPDSAARAAITAPLGRHGIVINENALAHIVGQTQGYPFFLQEWAYQVWNAAPASPITLEDARLAAQAALQRLDSGFFRVRFDRLTPREKAYMMAMAELGPGPHPSGTIAKQMRKKVTAVGPLRDGLIRKGMIYGPHHGQTAFTVPMFDDFMRRTQKPARRA